MHHSRRRTVVVQVAFAFTCWGELLEIKRRREAASQLNGLQKVEMELRDEIGRLQREIEGLKEGHEVQLAKADEEKELALQRQLTELTGSAEEIAAMREEKAKDRATHARCPDPSAFECAAHHSSDGIVCAVQAKEERVELLKRQIGRRILNQGLMRGFTAWTELWEAKSYAMGRLQECGAKFKAPSRATHAALHRPQCAAGARCTTEGLWLSRTFLCCLRFNLSRTRARRLRASLICLCSRVSCNVSDLGFRF